MRAKSGRKRATSTGRHQQVNVRLEASLYQALETPARQERRSMSQAARQLLEEGLRQRMVSQAMVDDTPGQQIGALAPAGGAFDWLVEEPPL